jgi:hypothetical protein
MSDVPSSETVNWLCPGPYWLVATLLAKTGLAVFAHDDALSRSAEADAVSRPMQ